MPTAIITIPENHDEASVTIITNGVPLATLHHVVVALQSIIANQEVIEAQRLVGDDALVVDAYRTKQRLKAAQKVVRYRVLN